MRRRLRGGAMAFYALYITFVGLPFMAMSVDLSRYWALRARLQNATDAACAAYAQYPDIDWYVDTGEVRFGSDASAGAFMVFVSSMKGKQGNLHVGMYPSQDPEVPVIHCEADSSIDPMIDIGITYTARAHAEAKMTVVSHPFK